LNFDIDEYRFDTDRNGSESSQLFTSAYDPPGFAVRTSIGKPIFYDTKNDCTVFITGMNVFIADNAESMVQEAGGHGMNPFLFLVWRSKKESLMSTFFN